MYIIPVLIYSMLCSVTVQLSKKRFGEAMPVTMIAAVLIVYISQFIFHTFDIGIILLLGLAAGGIIILFIRKKDIELFFSNGMTAFLLVCVITTIIDYNRNFTDFDEFWHWGMMIKESLRLDRFYCVPESRMIIHKDYPPFPALLELIWCKFAGGYNEGLPTIGLHTFVMSIVVLPLSKKASKLWQIICVTGFYFAVVLLFDHVHVYNTILSDIPLAIIFGYAIFLVLSDEVYVSGYGMLCLVLSGIAILMTKQIGVAMFMIVLLLYVVYGLTGEQSEKKRLFMGLIPLIIVPFLVNYSWKKYVNMQRINDIRAVGDGTGQFDLGYIKIPELISVLQGKGDEFKQEVFSVYLNALFTRDVASFPIIQISYVTVFFILCILIIMLAVFFNKKITGRRAIGIGSVYLCGTLGFAFMLSVMFLFCFTPDEMIELRGYQRYVDSFVLGEILALVMLMIFLSFSESKFWDKPILPVIVLVVGILLNFDNRYSIIPQSMRRDDYEQYREMADVIYEGTTEDSTISMIYDSAIYGGWYGFVQSITYYFDNDRDLIWGMDIFRIDINDTGAVDGALNQIRTSDYLYLVEINENVNTLLSQYMNAGESPKENTVYKVDVSGDEIVLHR